MASVTKDSKGWRIRFVDPDGNRKSFRPGKGTTKATAHTIGRHVEVLVGVRTAGGGIDRQTALWLTGIGHSLHQKLAKVGLVDPRQSGQLKSFIASYISQRNDAKSSTVRKWRSAAAHLVDHFGANADLRQIHSGHAAAFRSFLYDKGQSENTVRRYCGIAKQFFRAAQRMKLVEENPFSDQVASVVPNHDKFHFITREVTDKLLEAAPDLQWRVIIALCRYGGLRCPSEVLALKWTDIDWSQDRFRVTSSKTEHHDGGGSRIVPLFPEIRRELEDAYEIAGAGAVFVVTRYRDAVQNLRTTFRGIIDRAMVEPWPKPFQNLRSTRETELAEEFPLHVVTKWLGNSQLVAARHYLQTTDEHYVRAIEEKRETGSVATQVDQKTREQGRTGENPKSTTRENSNVFRGSARVVSLLPEAKVVPTGLEPVTFRM